MNKLLTKGLAAILSAAMLMGTAPAMAAHDAEEGADISLMSLLPLETVEAGVDLTDMLPAELANIKVLDFLGRMKDRDTGEPITIDSSAVTAVWEQVMDEDGDGWDGDAWKKTDINGTINLMQRYWGTTEEYFDIIVGSGNQLDPDNIRYSIDVKFPDNEDVYKFDLYEQTETADVNLAAVGSSSGGGGGDVVRTPIQIGSDRYSFRYASTQWNEDGERIRVPRINLSIAPQYSRESDYYLNIAVNTEKFPGYSITAVVEGLYDTPDEAYGAIDTYNTYGVNIDITKQITGQDMSKADAGYKYKWANYSAAKEITVIFSKNGKEVGADKFTLYAGTRSDDVDYYNNLYKKDEDGYWDSLSSCRSNYDDDNDIYIITQTMRKGYPADAEYYYSMEFYDGETDKYDSSKVTKAVVGHFDTLEEAANQPDIKSELFVDRDSNYNYDYKYKANFSGNGVDFTVFANDQVWKYTVVAVDNNEPDELSDSSSFRINDAYSADGNSYDVYDVDSRDDSYYDNGYYTLIINDLNADMTAIKPYGYVADNARVYCGGVPEVLDADRYSQQFSAQDFTKAPADPKINPRNSVQYTVTAENQEDQTNYNVTMVKRTEGAKLFVNGPDEREVFLDNYYDNRHDIFIANIGTEPLTGLKVTLNATNAKLDDYWTVGGNGNDTLAAMPEGSIGNRYQPNIGKIRIIPDGEGDIKGTLTISADGQEDRVINITGHAGNPKIVTTELRDAVKFVPYQSIVTTNNIHDWNKVTFSLYSGKLPKGVNLLKSGELYGVPQETGTFPIRVRAEFSADAFADSIASLTLKVLDNTDANVDAQTDEGYEIIKRVPSMRTASEQVFEFEYDYAEHKEEFQGFWLDGEKLEEGVDYTVDAGSTKITIASQTISKAGNGTHTIAAEYRSSSTNEVKKAAQNYKKSSSGGGNGGGGGSKPSSYKVWLEVNGGAWLQELTIKRDSVIADLPTPERAGYAFGGWYTDKELTKPFDVNTKINKTTTLYAKWIDIHTIWFIENGGEELEDLHIQDGTDTPKLPETVKTGFIFDGWYKDEALTQPFNSNDDITSSMSLYAKWRADVAPDTVLGFDDIHETDWFYSDVDWAYNNKLMVGISNRLFAPNESITGGMVVTVLARIAKADVAEYENNSFDDVYENEWYTPYAKWAKAIGLVDGIPFNPPKEISREWMGIIIMRFLDYMDIDYEVKDEYIEFADADKVSAEAEEALQKLYKIEIFRGKGDNIIDPASNTTRAEFAALMQRTVNFMK